MTTQTRVLSTWIGSALATVAFTGAAQSQQAIERPPNTQLPQQVIPTGAEDEPTAAASTARAVATAVPDAQTLERELVRMTSESDAGLVAVKQGDGSVRVDLDGRFMSVLIATPTSDGGAEITCHTGKDAREKVKQAQAIAAGSAPRPQRSSHAVVSKPAVALKPAGQATPVSSPTVLEEK